MDDKEFILWNPKKSPYPPRVDDDGKITSDGVLGRMALKNVYLSIYAEFPKGAKKLDELEVGESIKGVVYRLSRQKGVYDVYRVK